MGNGCLFFAVLIIVGCQKEHKMEEVLSTIELPYSDSIHPALTGQHMYVAVNANSEFYNELIRYDLKSQQKEEIPQVRLYHLETDEMKIIDRLETYALYNNIVRIANDQLLWTDSVDGKGYYKLYNLNDQTITTFEAPRRFPGYAELAGNKIYALDFDDYCYWDNQQFGVYDTSTQQYEPLDELLGEKNVNFFKVSSQSLAIQGATLRSLEEIVLDRVIALASISDKKTLSQG